jgi:hypothetical protein
MMQVPDDLDALAPAQGYLRVRILPAAVAARAM